MYPVQFNAHATLGCEWFTAFASRRDYRGRRCRRVA